MYTMSTVKHIGYNLERILSVRANEPTINTHLLSTVSQVRVIPLELQRLFTHLLLVDQQSASTTQLTDSFGWKNNEVCRDTNTQCVYCIQAPEDFLPVPENHNYCGS